jgi:HPr kinase/phosphorylase
MLVHGTCVELDGAGLLLCGPSGAGKSDLALRLITHHGAILVADDQVLLDSTRDALTASAPASLAGLLEVRGVGIVPLAHKASATLTLIVELCEREAVARMPEPETRTLDGCAIPLMRLYPHDASAPAKLRLMIAGIKAESETSDDI